MGFFSKLWKGIKKGTKKIVSGVKKIAKKVWKGTKKFVKKYGKYIAAAAAIYVIGGMNGAWETPTWLGGEGLSDWGPASDTIGTITDTSHSRG